jgi:hypothetical protein
LVANAKASCPCTVPRGEARYGVWVVPSIKNARYNGMQIIKTKLISEKIMIYLGASAREALPSFATDCAHAFGPPNYLQQLR